MMNNGGYFVWCLEENTSVSSSWKLFLLKFHWSSHVHPRAFGISRTPHWVSKKSEEFRPLCYFRSRPQGEAMSVSFWLIIYTHLNGVTTNREWKNHCFNCKDDHGIFFICFGIDQHRFLPHWSRLVADCWRILMEYYRIQYYDCELF